MRKKSKIHHSQSIHNLEIILTFVQFQMFISIYAEEIVIRG